MSESATPGNKNDQVELSSKELRELCFGALHAAGASEELAGSMAHATVEAERRGRSSTGASHLISSVEALRNGRLKPDPDPVVESRRTAIIAVDADDGPVHLAFDRARDHLAAAARETGIAMLGIERSYAWGELGYLACETATEGLIAMAGTNSPALMSIFGAGVPVTGTNPFAFAVPSGVSQDGAGQGARPRLIDQASSEAAWVKVRSATERGDAIPEGWAVDAQGEPTTDPDEALAGAMLPFGGVKGANIAVLVEVLSTLAGGAFSMEGTVPGDTPSRIGAWVIAIDPEAFGSGYIERFDAHCARLEAFIGHDYGRRRPLLETMSIPWHVYDELIAVGQ